MRSFEFARKMKDGEPLVYPTDRCQVDAYEMAYPEAQLPEYQTEHAAGADFFCAEEVTILPFWSATIYPSGAKYKNHKPTLVHTGIKANMEEDEVLELYNRSSNPKKLGLVLANGVGVVDADYYNNLDNDGEIMFAFFNISDEPVTLHVGDRIGQGVFKKYLRPTEGLRIKDAERTGGFGSTGKN